MDKSEAYKTFEHVIVNICPECKAVPGKLCDTTALWVHLERINLANKKIDFSTYWQHMVDRHDETHESLYFLVFDVVDDHPDWTPRQIIELVHNRQHTSLDWDAGHHENDLSSPILTDVKIPKIKEFTLSSRLGAGDVLGKLSELISVYRTATLADLYDLVGLPHDLKDERWGWTNIDRAGIDRVKEGYVLRLPPVNYIK